jgi:metal-responsive CopG/Arc/MetJ family transcriptional regulator
MGARSVQISLEERLLARIDRHPIAKKHGRSALIKDALEEYLAGERRRAHDEAYARGYGSRGSKRLEHDLGPLIAGQQWPED